MRSGVLAVAAMAATFAPAQEQVGLSQGLLPEGHTCRITVDDPLPWIRAALTSEVVAQAVRSGPLGDVLAVTELARDVVPANLWRQVQLFEDLVPERVTLAFPPSTSGGVMQVLRASVARDVLAATYGAERTPEQRLQAAREHARATLVDAVRGVAGIAFSVSLQCRTERVADEWFESVADELEFLPDEEEQLETSDSRVRVRMPLHDLLPLEVFDPVFADYVIDEDEAREAAWQVLEGVVLELEAVLDGRTIVIQVCADRGGAAAAATPMLPVPSVRGDALASWQIDLGSAADTLASADAFWQEYRNKELGKIVVGWDGSGVQDDLALFEREMRQRQRMSGAIGWDEGGVYFALEQPAAGTVEDVVDSSLWRFVPETAAFYHVDGTTTLAESAYDLMLRVDETFERRSGEAWERGADNAEQLVEQTEAYYERARALRELLRTEGAKVLRAPTLALVDQPRARDGIQWRAPGLVMAGRLRAGADGRAYLRRIAAELVSVLGLDGQTDVEERGRALGLGVPTVSLPIPMPPGSATLDVDLHGFVVDGHLVLSTSPKISRAIIAGMQEVRILEQPAGTVAAGATNGVRLAAVVRSIGAGIGSLLAGSSERATVMDGAYINLASCAVGEALRMFAGCRFSTSRSPSGLRSEGVFRFRSDRREQRLEALLARSRKAIGPWPARAAALRAQGASRYRDVDGTFAFVCGKQGYIHNRIDAIAYEENVWTGAEAWSRNEGRLPRTLGIAERDLLIAFNAIWSGQWTESPAGIQLSLPADALPGTPPEVLMTFVTSDTCMRVWLDPDTGLPSAFSMNGHAQGFVTPYRLGDYRAVRGRMLPYVVRHPGPEGSEAYRVRSWKTATMREGRPARPVAKDDTVFRGEPEAGFRSDHGGVVQVQAGGKQVWLQFSLWATETAITRSALREMGVGVKDDEMWATVKRLRVGPMTMRDHVVRVMPDPPAEAGDADRNGAAADLVTTNGTIGIAIAARACVELDHRAQVLRLTPPGSFDDHPGEFVEVGYLARCPTVPLQLDRKTVVACPLVFGPMRGKFLFGGGAVFRGYRIDRDSLHVAGSITARHGMLGGKIRNATLAGQPLEDVSVLWPTVRSLDSVPTTAPVFLGIELLDRDFVMLLDLRNERAALVERR